MDNTYQNQVLKMIMNGLMINIPKGEDVPTENKYTDAFDFDNNIPQSLKKMSISMDNIKELTTAVKDLTTIMQDIKGLLINPNTGVSNLQYLDNLGKYLPYLEYLNRLQ